MSSQPVQDIEAALREMERLAGSGTSNHASRSRKAPTPVKHKEAASSTKKSPANPFVWLLKSGASLAFLIALPFLMLVRISLMLNVDRGFNVWLALSVSILATTVVLLIYVAFLRRRFMGKMAISRRMTKMMLALVVLYCGYSLIYLSGTNVKSDAVRSTYLSLHPSLRVATSTLVILDRSLVVTDMARQPEDYLSMGLPVRENSLHYKQASGYVEAVDIRTNGKSELLNQLVRAYYWVMGFKTLRHTGTADHLHVSVPQR